MNQQLFLKKMSFRRKIISRFFLMALILMCLPTFSFAQKKVSGTVNDNSGVPWDAAAIARYPGATPQSSVDPVSGKTYIDVYKGTDYDNPVFDENKNYLWPIPLSALSQNPKLGQNPGW